MVHGKNDPLASPAGSKMLFDRASSQDKSAYFIANMFHDMLLEPGAPTVFRVIDDWLLQRTGENANAHRVGVVVCEDSFVAEGTDVIEEDILHALRHRVSVENAVEHGKGAKSQAWDVSCSTAMQPMGGGGAGGSDDKNARMKKD